MYFFGRLTYIPTSYTVSGTQTNTENLGVLKQIEFFYKILPKLHIGFGRFLTTFGYESPMRSNNLTYNYSIARQTLYPIYAEGIRAKYVAHEYVTLTLSNYNKLPDASFGDDNKSSKATEAALSGTIGKFAWYGGFLTSRDEKDLEKVDNKATSLWISYVFRENFSLIGTYDNRSSQKDSDNKDYAQSMSGTLAYRLEKHNLYFRFETVTGAKDINEINGSADYLNGDKVQSLTLGDKFVIHKNLYLYAEYRRDHVDKKAFMTHGGSPAKDMTLVTLGAIARF